MRDIFICHAGEDKEEIVRPMVESFNQAGISCWYDEAEIKWGDSVVQKVDDGLASSRYVIVVFSINFIQKNWPQRELNSVLNQEATTGEVKVLPLLVGSQEEKRQILNQYPLLNDKLYLPWDGNLRNIVTALQSRLNPDEASQMKQIKSHTLGLNVPLPKIKKEFTQRDKDLFLKNSFVIIKDYFQNALQALSQQYQEVDTDFTEVHNFKFISTIYVRGEIGNKCKIWIGGLSSSDSIAYHEGEFAMDGDNSFNDMLSIEDDEQSLGLKPSMMWHGGYQDEREKILTAEGGAEYLWKKFTNSLG